MSSIFRRSYNEAFKAVQDLAVQYFTCDVSLFEDASNLLEAMHEQQKSAFMRPEMSQCLLDPWFIEYFPNFVSEEAIAQNKTVKPSKDFLLKFANKFSPLRPLVDPQVMTFCSLETQCFKICWLILLLLFLMRFCNFAPFCFCFDLPKLGNSTADFYQNSALSETFSVIFKPLSFFCFFDSF